MSASSPAPRPAVALPLVAVLVLFVALYARAASFDYVWDDVATLRDNPAFDQPLLDGLRLTQHAHLDPTITHLRGVAPAHESYRPLLFLAFAAEVAVAGRSARVMHVDNVLLGLLAVLLAYDVAARLFRDARAGVLVAAVFALHPLQVEPVCYVSARADVLAGLLALASVALVLRGAPVALPALLFLASLFVKEAHLGLPLVLVAGAWLLRRRELLRPGWVLAATLPAYAALRALLLPASAPAAVGNSGTALRGLLALPGLVLQYATLFLAPRGLSTVRPWHATWEIAGLALVAPGALVLAWAVRTRRLQGGDPGLAAFGLAWAGVTTGPSAIVARIMHVVADRYAYLPVFGFAVTAAALGRLAWTHKLAGRRVLAGGAAAWGIACLGVAAVQVGTWRSETTLGANAVAVEPDSATAHYDAGLLLARAERWREAAPEFERALALDETNARARNNLAVTYLNLGRLPDAERLLRDELRASDGANFRAWYNLARVQAQQGRRTDACTSLGRALAVNPGYARARADAQALCGGARDGQR